MHRNADRQPGSFLVTVHAAKFEVAGNVRLIIIDKADFRRGAAHIKRQRSGFTQLCCHALGENSATRRAGFHQTHWLLDAGLQRGDPAAGGHQKQRDVQPARG